MNYAASDQFLAYGPKVVTRNGRLFALREGKQRAGGVVVFDFEAQGASLDTLQYVLRPVPYSDALQVEIRFYSESSLSTQVVQLGSLKPSELSQL